MVKSLIDDVCVVPAGRVAHRARVLGDVTVLPRWRRRQDTALGSVAVLGAGHGGLALAAFVARQGHSVALWNRSAEPIDAVHARGGVLLHMPGEQPALTPMAKATTDVSMALAGARVVLVAVPACAHVDVARACAPHLRDGQTVLLLPGRTGGALEFRRVLREEGCRAEIVLGETNSFPLTSRQVAPGDAVIFGTKAELTAAALPARDTARLIAECSAFLPMLEPARSVLHTGLSNVGAILHPTITLLNAGRIERGESFDFYTEGVTAHVAQVLAAADAERLRIARAYGESVQPLTEWIASAYGHRADTVHAALAGNPAYVGIKAPTTIRHRYLFEDVPTGLIPLIELGAAAGLALPTLRSLVNLAELHLGGEVLRDRRSLESLGLGGRSIAEIRSVIASGEQHRPTEPILFISPRRHAGRRNRSSIIGTERAVA
jgi:opine dehydrogenase